MSSPLQNITVSAPGFRGVNTQDSPIDLDPSYASIANNCVIDNYGRVGARKGREALTVGVSLLGSSAGLTAVHEHVETAGTTKVFSTADDKILSGTVTLVDETPAAYVITSPNWKIIDFNYHCYFFQTQAFE